MTYRSTILLPLTSFIFLALCPLARAADWTLTTANFHTKPVNVASIDDAGVRATGDDGSAETIAWSDVLELSRATPLHLPGGKFDLYLLGGDRVSGEPIALSGDTLKWKDPVVGEIHVPIGRAVAISKSGKTPDNLDEQRKEDVVRLANGDSTRGIVANVSASAVSVQVGDSTSDVPLDQIVAVLFTTPTQRAAGDSRAFRVRLGDGSTLTAQTVASAGGQLDVALDAKARKAIDFSAVAGIEQVNGPISWLTSRTPSQTIYKPYFDESFPPRIDFTVGSGEPIAEKFPGFRHGFGCHSYTKLVYPLDGKYAAFRTQYAIEEDDASAASADVTVRILLDEKVVHEQKHVRAGKVWPVVILPLDGAKSLALEVDYGDNLSAGDRFAWLDPALLKTMPPPPPATQPMRETTPATQPTTAPSGT